MKRKTQLMGLILILIIAMSACSKTENGNTEEAKANTASKVFSANLDGYEFTPAEGGPGLISTNYKQQEIIDNNYIGLFVNGEFILNSGTQIVNDRVEAPISAFTNAMGMESAWDAGTRILTIKDGDKTVAVDVDNSRVTLDGKNVELGKYPEIINDKIYGTSEFFQEAFNAKVSFYNGLDSTATMMIPRLKHAMISRYPEDTTPIKKEDALELVKRDLIIAYEKRYGAYTPLEGENKVSITDPNYDSEKLKEGIRDLRVTSENDRFYIVPFAWDFWVDKYTGEVYTFYNGLTMQIHLFNPHTKGALTFAG